MKKQLNYIITISIISGVVFLFSLNSCKKDSADSTDTPPTPMGTVEFHMHTNIDTTEVDSGTIVTDSWGRHYQLNFADFFISAIRLKKADGSWQSVDNVYLLKTMNEEVYVVGSVPAGNYLAPSFNVGLDAAANGTTPSSHSSGPLSIVDRWFGSTLQGYKFMDVRGLADTTAAQTGTPNVPFSYQLGTSAMLKTVTMPDHAFTVVADQIQYVHITADYSILLQWIDFKTQTTADPFSNSTNIATAMQIANNIPNMFRYEE